MNQTGEISSSGQVWRIIPYNGFTLSWILFTAIKKVCLFFSVVLSIHFSLNFSYAILPSYHSKLNFFLVVSEIKCKNGEGEIFLEIILFEYYYVKMALNLKGMGF